MSSQTKVQHEWEKVVKSYCDMNNYRCDWNLYTMDDPPNGSSM